METTPLRAKILDTIIRKSTLKQKVFDNSFAAFNTLKETLLEMASEMDDELDGKLDRRVRLEYRDRGKFEAQLQVCLLYTSPSPRDRSVTRMPSSA